MNMVSVFLSSISRRPISTSELQNKGWLKPSIAWRACVYTAWGLPRISSRLCSGSANLPMPDMPMPSTSWGGYLSSIWSITRVIARANMMPTGRRAACHGPRLAGAALRPPQAWKEAFTWYKKAAEQDGVEAQYALSMLYEQGRGVDANASQSLLWVRKAAEQGHTGAQLRLACRYEAGASVEQDEEQAFHWYRKAAEQGEPAPVCTACNMNVAEA